MFIENGTHCLKRLLKPVTIFVTTKGLRTASARFLHKRSEEYQSMRDLGAPRILYKSDNFLCVDKTFDVKINSDDPEEKRTVEHQVRRFYPELVDPRCKHGFRFAHRLDMATTGILTLALNKKASKHLASKFKTRQVVKYYLALVRGHVADDAMFINIPTGDLVDPDWPFRRCVYSDPRCSNPQTTTTLMMVLDRGMYDGEPATKVFLNPFTGKQHQLRVHCDYIGHTIIGDYTYSGRADTKPSRMMLHAQRLYTSMNIETLDITSPDPFVSREKVNIDSTTRDEGFKTDSFIISTEDGSKLDCDASIDCPELGTGPLQQSIRTDSSIVHDSRKTDVQVGQQDSIMENCMANGVFVASESSSTPGNIANKSNQKENNGLHLESVDSAVNSRDDIPTTYNSSNSAAIPQDNGPSQTLHLDHKSGHIQGYVYDSVELEVLNETAEKWKSMEVCMTYKQAVNVAEDFHPGNMADNIKLVSIDTGTNSTSCGEASELVN